MKNIILLLALHNLTNYASAAITASTPTEYEQYMLEILNRARADPDAEVARLPSPPNDWSRNPADLNEGLAAGTITNTAKQPLAFNTSLINAAQSHANWNLLADDFSHNEGAEPVPNTVCWTGDTPTDRAIAAGYGSGVGENLGVGVSSSATAFTSTA